MQNGVAAANAEYSEYQMPQPVPKPVSNVDFFAKNQAGQQQENQSQLSLFGSDGAEDNQEYFEAGQASQQPQQSQPTANSWWTPDNAWMANNSNNQRDQSQVYMQMKAGNTQSSPQSQYPGTLYSMPQAVNSDPTPMYSFMQTNANQPHKMAQTAAAGLNVSRVQGAQGSTSVKNPQYDFQGLLNGPGYNQGGSVGQNMNVPEQHRYRLLMQEASREQQLRMHGQQSQSLNRYEGQNVMESPIKVSDYDFLGGDFSMKGQPQAEIGQQLEEGDSQMWRQQQQQQQQQLQQQQQRQQQPPSARQLPHQFNAYAGGNSYEEMQQRQQHSQVGTPNILVPEVKYFSSGYCQLNHKAVNARDGTCACRMLRNC